MKDSTKILIVDDEIEYRETYRMLLEDRGFIIGEAASAKEALSMMEREYYPIVLSDIIMPGEDGISLLRNIKQIYKETVEVIIVTGYGSVEGAVEAMKIGALGYFIKSGNPEELFIEIEKAKRFIKFETQMSVLKRVGTERQFLEETKSPIMKQILQDIEALSNSTCNVLLTGESGVGKEVFAKLIHKLSDRSESVFLPTNCQAISGGLLEAELFGHEKGAFTGADTKRIGRFEEANGGTMFLDEIGEISAETQVKLLRVLDNRYVERIGSNKSIPVNFRLISATNRKLLEEMKVGSFREDLYYRINTITIEIPPLRERREDISGMINFFVAQYSLEMKKDIRGIEPQTEKYLLNYDYPGNVRELKNMIERLIVLSKDGILALYNNDQIQSTNSFVEKKEKIIPYKVAKREFEIKYIKNALSSCDNNITKTAKMIEMSRRQLFNKLIEYDLNRFE